MLPGTRRIASLSSATQELILDVHAVTLTFDDGPAVSCTRVWVVVWVCAIRVASTVPSRNPTLPLYTSRDRTLSCGCKIPRCGPHQVFVPPVCILIFVRYGVTGLAVEDAVNGVIGGKASGARKLVSSTTTPREALAASGADQ
ncbi:hypothetical protein JB92DRAFT_2988846 [Gautieria morchelliformis]|nr:hypothetical protein JB92DRAFT_2988846 [Gautieria morchelliformis]